MERPGGRVLFSEQRSGLGRCPSTQRCPVSGINQSPALRATPAMTLSPAPPSLLRCRRVRNAQRLSLGEPERRGLLSPDRAADSACFFFFLFPPSRGKAQGHRRVSAPALGGWEGQEANGAGSRLGRRPEQPGRGGAWGARPGLSLAPARGLRTRSPRPTTPSSAGRGPGIGQAPPGTARETRPAWSTRRRRALGLALPALPAQSAALHPELQRQETGTPLQPVGLSSLGPDTWGPHEAWSAAQGARWRTITRGREDSPARLLPAPQLPASPGQ